MQLDVFPDQTRLRREEPEKNVRRFYMMVVQRDLFGGASLVREWGRLSSPGRVQIDHHPDEGQAIDALANLMTVTRARLRRYLRVKQELLTAGTRVVNYPG
ncbi:WGR domain-containing protein [Roseovarius sp.]|uniref:WGR domain-containing protein n=1 Tax=Roseovarius sp. TaxID=1486281 RepID=UPI0035672CCA